MFNPTSLDTPENESLAASLWLLQAQTQFWQSAKYSKRIIYITADITINRKTRNIYVNKFSHNHGYQHADCRQWNCSTDVRLFNKLAPSVSASASASTWCRLRALFSGSTGGTLLLLHCFLNQLHKLLPWRSWNCDCSAEVGADLKTDTDNFLSTTLPSNLRLTTFVVTSGHATKTAVTPFDPP